MKILLVEDHRDLRKMMAGHLFDRGFVVDTVDTLVREVPVLVSGDVPTLIVTARDALEAVTPDALEAVVSRMRRRLADVGANVRIKTRRGIGYQLVVSNGAGANEQEQAPPSSPVQIAQTEALSRNCCNDGNH